MKLALGIARGGSSGSTSAEKFEKPGSPSVWQLCMLKVLVGRSVEVYLKDESIISGVFLCADIKPWSVFVLENALVKAKFTGTEKPVSYTDRKRQTMILQTADIVYISAKVCEEELTVSLDQHQDKARDCAFYDTSESLLTSRHKNKIEEAAPHNIQLSSSSLSVQQQQQLDVQQQQPEQQQQQQQYPERMFEHNTYEGMGNVTLEFQDTPDKIRSLGFWAGKLRRPYRSEKNVVIREYKKDIESFFSTMRKIKHIYILEARYKLPVQDEKGLVIGCVIAYGPVDETLKSFVTRFKQTESELSEGNKVGLIARVMREVLTALNHTHALDTYHGRITWEDVYVCITSGDEKQVSENFSVRLSFPCQANYYIDNPNNEAFRGSKLADFQSAARMLEQLVKTLELADKRKFDHMIKGLLGSHTYTIVDFDWESDIWTLSLKISFVRFIAKSMRAQYNPENFESQIWTTEFEIWTAPVHAYCTDKGLSVATYSNRLSDYVRFIDDTFSHVHEYSQNLQLLFGPAETIMNRFEKFTPNLFQLLTDYARSYKLVGTLTDSRKMFSG